MPISKVYSKEWHILSYPFYLVTLDPFKLEASTNKGCQVWYLKFSRVQTGKETTIFGVRRKGKHIGKIFLSDILKSSLPPATTAVLVKTSWSCFKALLSLSLFSLGGCDQVFFLLQCGRMTGGKNRENWEVIFPFQQKTSSMEVIGWITVATLRKGCSQPAWLPPLDIS